MIDLALQLVLVVLLLLTITWCVIVHHRLRRLRADQGELEAFIAALGEATDRAEAAVRQMQEANRSAASAVEEQERRARQQSEQLARLMDNAVRVVKRLDAAVEHGATRVAELRSRGPAPLSAATAEAPARGSPEDLRSPRPDGAGAPAATSERRAARPTRRRGQLDGLLHGELLEALQGLR
jgi:biopolymer transport protein ExbB/TolQ